MKKEGRKIKKKLIILLIVFIMIIGAVVLATKINQIGNSEKSMIGTEEMKNNKISEIGEQGIITSAQIIGTKTGTAPFDADDNPGNDSSENNNIVRSFDQIEWTIDLTMGLKSGATSSNLKGGRINVEVTLPEACKNVVEWKLERMEWLEGGNVSEDGITLTGYYDMSEEEITIPGKQTLSFVLDIYGAGNKTEIIPTFIFGLEGNSASDRKTISGEKILVSAIGKYNVELKMNTKLSNKATIDYGYGNTTGRMYGASFALQLYNENIEKGLKGIEYPKGDITFDMNLKLERTKANSSELEDITNECTPILWNYRANNWDRSNLSGNIPSRDFFYNYRYHVYESFLPLGVNTGNRLYSVYDSGNISIIQEGKVLHVTIKDYKFDKDFPHHEALYDTAPDNIRNKIYTENIGTFSVGYMQIFIPDNSESTIADRNYKFSINDNNVTFTSTTNSKINNQTNNDDDYIEIQHYIEKDGKYGQSLYFLKENCESSNGAGDGKAEIGSSLWVRVKFMLEGTNDYDVYTSNKFVKFDGDCVEPIYLDNGRRYQIEAMEGNPEFRVWYVTKKDGTNWSSQTEMNNANIENMDIYNNIEDIPDNKICIGIYFENISGYFAIRTGDNNSLEFPIRIKNTAKIGQTYGFTQRTQMWVDKLDRNVYSIIHPENKYPTPDWDSGNRQYVKTEYDRNGKMINGTHYQSQEWGNTLLIVGANLHGNIKTIDSNNTEKTNYDLGKNENIVKYKIIPQLDKNENLSVQIGGVSLKAQVSLPKGLKYLEMSCEYGEPEIVNNSDGSQTLTWKIYNCQAGNEIEPIEFEAQIDNETENGTQYTATFIMSEDTDDYGVTKIGNNEIKNRTSTSTINIINLASHRLYKEVNSSVIENNKELIYKIVYENKTENTLPEFQLLDILPYNGDKRGSRFSGNYTIKNIQLKTTINGIEQNNSQLQIFTTNSENVKEMDAKNTGIGIDSIWKKINNGENLSESATGIAVKGSIFGKEKVEMQITLQTNGNKSKDIYLNNAMAQVTKNSDQMETGNVEALIVERYLQKELEVSTIITVTDNMSGVGKIEYAWNNSNTEEPSSYTNVEGLLNNPIKLREMLSEGTHYLWVRATDNVGNVSNFVSKPFIVKAPD